MPLFTASPALYKFHRLALSPLISDDPGKALATVHNTVQQNEEKQFLTFILQNGLGPLWHEVLKQNHTSPFFSKQFTETLKQTTLHTTAVLVQRKLEFCLV